MVNKTPDSEHGFPNITNSKDWLRRAEAIIPSSTQTLAKGPTQYVQGISPVFAHSGNGAYITDVDGNEYLDYTMGVGPLILGYNIHEINEAIREQLEKGITFSLMHSLEVEVAELIGQFVPNADMVRFSKTGADAVSAAIRVSRAFTGRDEIVCCGYHGWHDWYIGVNPRNAGVPACVQELVHTFEYNDIESLKRALNANVAAVVMEPMVFEYPTPGFLEEVRQLCANNGTLLIFDEMWTGFRFGMGGAQEHFGVKADLACFSKAIANGMPLSAVVGREDVMKRFDEDVFFYTTFGGEALSLAAAKETLSFLDSYDVLSSISVRGNELRSGIESIISANNLTFLSVEGYPARTRLAIRAFADESVETIRAFIQQGLIQQGILWTGFHNLSYSHKADEIDRTIVAYDNVLRDLASKLGQQNLAQHIKGSYGAAAQRPVQKFNSKPRELV